MREDIKLVKWFRRPDIYPIEIPGRKEAEYVETEIFNEIKQEPESPFLKGPLSAFKLKLFYLV